MAQPARRGRAAPSFPLARAPRRVGAHKSSRGRAQLREAADAAALARWRPPAPRSLLSLLLGSGRQERSSVSGHGESAQQRGGSGPAAPPRQASPRLGGFSSRRAPRPHPPGSRGTTRVSGGAASRSPSAPGASLCSDSYGLRRVPLASGAFAPIAGRPVAHGRVHLQVTFCKRPAQRGRPAPAQGAWVPGGRPRSRSHNPLKSAGARSVGPVRIRPSARGARAPARTGAPSRLAAFR